MTLAPGEFRVGHVLSRALEILLRDFAKFFLIALVAVVPGAVLTFSGGIRVSSLFGVPIYSAAGTPFLPILATMLVSIPFRTIGQAVSLYGAFQDMRGRPFHLGEAFARGLARFFPLLGLAIVWTFAIAGGTLLLIVPGLMMVAAFYVVLPACVMEGLGPLQSMSRSAALTKGHRWKIFGIYVLIVAVSGIVGTGIRTAFSMAGLVTEGMLATAIWNTLFSAYNSIIIAVIYHDLRVLKDGIDIDRIAAVFD